LGDAETGDLGLRNVAATQRFSGHYLRRKTGEIIKQATQNSQIVAAILVGLLSSQLAGCKSSPPIAWSKPSINHQTVAAHNVGAQSVSTPAVGAPTAGVQNLNANDAGATSQLTPSKPAIGLVSFQGNQTIDSTGQQKEAAVDSTQGPVSTDDSAARTSNAKTTDATQPVLPIDKNFGQSVGPGKLALTQVLDSVAQCYPEIEVAIGEIEAAEGKILSSWGEFDSAFEAHSISQPLGFYQNYRNGLGVARPLWSGGEVYGAYRIGRGNFQPWYGERATDEAGEFKAGFSLPLLKDRAIDLRRTKVQSAIAGRDEIESDVDARLLLFQRFATQAYWDWVASGQAVEIQKRLLGLAQLRVSQINERVLKGDLPKIAQIDNDRFIAKRQNDLIKAQRLLEKAAIKISLFNRDGNCNPVIPQPEQLPVDVPGAQRINNDQLEMDTATAIAVRPEIQALGAARRRACIELQYANNLTLPKLDLKGFASKDLGQLASSSGDKRPFEMELGVIAEVPIQRREGLGKIRTARGKLTQIDAKTQFVTDKVRAEIQDAASAVNAAFDQIQQSQRNVDLARQSLELGNQLFQAGDIDLIELNIYENSVADAELELLEAYFKYFFYRVVYETAKSGVAFE
jgi:outer membrane protein TolC